MEIIEQTFQDSQSDRVAAGILRLAQEDAEPRQRPPIGKLLRDLRGTRTLRQVEADTGVTNAYLSNIELGLKNPGIKTLTKLSRYYRTPLEHLLHVAGREDEVPEPAQEDSVIDIQRAFDFVMGDPNISRFERPRETPSLDMQKFVVGIYEHFTGRRLI